MANLADAIIRLSGGVANVNPFDSLGGIMSTAAGGIVDSQSATAPTTITGVVIDDANGNALGAGSLFFDFSAGTLRWTPPAGTAGAVVVVSVDGVYAIQGANDGGLLAVTVTAASLPGSDQTNTITITALTNNIFDDVTKAQSDLGRIEHRGLYFENAHASDSMVGALIWISANTPGQDVVNIGLDPAGLNGVAVVIATEDLVPAGVTFSNPTTEATGLSMGTLAFGDNFPFWIRRTVPAGVSAAEPNDTFSIAIKVKV